MEKIEFAYLVKTEDQITPCKSISEAIMQCKLLGGGQVYERHGPLGTYFDYSFDIYLEKGGD